jgi:hypothetical protein
MEPREHYTSKDFKRYARKEFANDFTAFRNTYICVFERKTCFDENNAAHDIDALLVDHYHRREVGPAAWVQATATGVRYYSGKGSEKRCYLIPGMHVSRIYFDQPYSSIIGTLEEKGRMSGRKPGHFVVETIINVLLLLTGRLEQVSNPYKTDMLGNFRHVCKVAASKAEPQDTILAVAIEPAQQDEEPQEVPIQRVRKKRKRVSRDRSPSIKQEEGGADIDDQTSHTQHGVVQHTPTHSPTAYRHANSTPRPSLLVSWYIILHSY